MSNTTPKKTSLITRLTEKALHGLALTHADVVELAELVDENTMTTIRVREATDRRLHQLEMAVSLLLQERQAMLEKINGSDDDNGSGQPVQPEAPEAPEALEDPEEPKPVVTMTPAKHRPAQPRPVNVLVIRRVPFHGMPADAMCKADNSEDAQIH